MTETIGIDLSALAAEFPQDAVHWRVQGQPYERNGSHSAMALAYIDARDVMDRLDAVCGPGNWQNRYSETATGRVLCEIGICIDGAWVWKSDGAGNTAVEGEKGGISDALKRAAVLWGIGRYLYRLDSPWVKCTVNQKNNKTYWKAWAEDPWSKVKRTQYKDPPAPKAETPTQDEIISQAKADMSNAKTVADLGKVWKGLGKAVQAEIEAFKDARKAELTDFEPAGPDVGDGQYGVGG